MRTTREKAYCVNGIESNLHCLFFNVKEAGPRRPASYHYHPYIEVLYCLKGEGIVGISGELYTLQSGMLLIINSGRSHFLQITDNTQIACIKFSPELLYESGTPSHIYQYALPFITYSQDKYILTAEQTRSTDIGSIIMEITNEWIQQEEAYSLVIQADIFKILATVFRIWRKESKSPWINELTPEVKRALDYTAQNYKTCTMKEVALFCGLSYHYFSQQFHRCMGVTFQDYLTTLKINEAVRLLLTTNQSVTQIGIQAGFPSTSHFISCFRQKKSTTPARFRASYSDQEITDANQVYEEAQT